MWKLLIPVLCFVASTSSQQNYPYPGMAQGYPQGGSFGGGGGGGGYSGSQMGSMGAGSGGGGFLGPQMGSMGAGSGGGGFLGPQMGSMGAGSFGGSSTGQGKGQATAQLDQVMNQLQSVFGKLEQNGFFDQFSSMMGSASNALGGSGQAVSGFAKQLTDQLKSVFSQGGAGEKLTQTLGNVIDSTGGVKGFTDRLGQMTQTFTGAAGGGRGAGGPRPPYRGYGAVSSRDIEHDDEIQVQARAADQ